MVKLSAAWVINISLNVSTRAVLNDERTYSDPFTFNPGRFIADGRLDSSVRDTEAAFGYGRRIWYVRSRMSVNSSEFSFKKKSWPAYGSGVHLVEYWLHSNVLQYRETC